jgi:hypothetical protein
MRNTNEFGMFPAEIADEYFAEIEAAEAADEECKRRLKHSIKAYEAIARRHAQAVRRGDFCAAVTYHHHSRRMVNRETKQARLLAEDAYREVYWREKGHEV